MPAITELLRAFVFLVYNSFMAVYFFYGEEDFNIDIELDKMRSKLNPDFLAMSYKVLDTPDFTDLITVLRSSPMMFGSSLAVINIQNYFFGENYNFEDKELEEIQDSLDNNQDGIDIVFVARIPRGEGKKIDSRRKLFKILSKYNSKEFQPFKTYKTAEITNWIKTRAKDKKLKIDDEACLTLIEQIGNNLRQFDNELDKLKLIAYPENIISKKMVQDNCISNQDLFNITNYLMKGEKGKAVMEFKQLLNVKYPLEILSALQTMLRQWIIVKAKNSAPVQEVMKLTGIRYDFMVNNLKKDLKNIPLKDLVKLKENLYDVEYRIKSGQVIDIDSEVEIALIR